MRAEREKLPGLLSPGEGDAGGQDPGPVGDHQPGVEEGGGEDQHVSGPQEPQAGEQGGEGVHLPPPGVGGVPGGRSEGQGHQEARHTEEAEGDGDLEPHLGADDGDSPEQEVDGDVAQDSTQLVQTPENTGVPRRRLLAGVDGEESSLQRFSIHTAKGDLVEGMISTNQSAVSGRIWTNERSPLHCTWPV